MPLPPPVGGRREAAARRCRHPEVAALRRRCHREVVAGRGGARRRGRGRGLRGGERRRGRSPSGGGGGSGAMAAEGKVTGQSQEQFLLLAKAARGAALASLIHQVLEAPGIYVFGELLDMPAVREVRPDRPSRGPDPGPGPGPAPTARPGR